MPPQPQSSMGLMNGSPIQQQVHGGAKPQQMPPNFGPAALFNHFSSMFDNNNQVGNNQVWGACHLPARSPPEQQYSAPPAYMGQMDGMMAPPPDSSKAPGYRSASQRMVNSPIALSLTSYATSMSGSPVYLHGPAAVGTPSFSRQHFSPHPWSAATSGESQAVPPPSKVSSSGPAAPPPHQTKQGQGGSQQDRKVPPPIGTERLARIRQTTVNPPLLPTSYTAPVGQGGIWSFGVGSASEAMSGWSQPLMGSHMVHPGLQADHTFSQYQPMEQDDSGISNPANYHQQHINHPNNYMDFPKGMAMSMYGGTILPPHPPMGESPGGGLFSGLHAADPAWSPIIKVVPNNADNTDPQQVWPGTWAPHVHLNHVN
ncbi:unnamed protein product [Oncorhynchus mykiss]|uniref:Uncharacterized protein n=2 Tax=Oncorhynchus mykiss TaxID=8022 RepID=A0A060YA43_ONCMY|nr:unnamed protein product [Oncorhynchus mykiss]